MRAQLFALLLLLPSAVPAQDVESALAAVVRISGTRNQAPVRGSGFVVAKRAGAATVVTASHVVQGARFDVTFSGSTASFADVQVLYMETDNPHGLAVFEVRGVTVLEVDPESRPDPGPSLDLLGFPQMSLAPEWKQRSVSARLGTRLKLDLPVGEGFSGGPVIRDGKVVGVVTQQDELATYAISAVVLGAVLEDLPVTLGITERPPPPPAPLRPREAPCVSGKETETVEGIVFVRICEGSFQMGSNDYDSEKPVHQVQLSEYWIGKYEVTNEQYSSFKRGHKGQGDLPAVNVSWNDANAFCESFGFRLPTEAEWENAARAGSDTSWSFGDDESDLGKYAWYGEGFEGPAHPVGKKAPNDWGLHDMLGNVWEWVADWYGDYSAESEPDPTGPGVGDDRVLRGGSFAFGPRVLRSAGRSGSSARAPRRGTTCGPSAPSSPRTIRCSPSTPPRTGWRSS